MRVVQVFTPIGRLEIDGLGEWNWTDGETIIFISDDLGWVENQRPKDFSDGYLRVFHPVESRFVIGTSARGEIVWRFNADSGRIEAIAPLLGRQELIDPGLFFVQVYANNNSIALIYEGGLLLFNNDGSLRWRQDNLQLDSKFQELTDLSVEYYNTYDGERWSYGIKDGVRMGIQ